jgi:hypothetical protein
MGLKGNNFDPGSSEFGTKLQEKTLLTYLRSQVSNVIHEMLKERFVF